MGRPRLGSAVALAVMLSLGAAAAVGATTAPPAAAADFIGGESTTGTASTVSPSTIASGGSLSYTLSGFPPGAIVQILIDDGAVGPEQSPAASTGSPSGGAVAQFTVQPDGTYSGAFELPAYVPPGTHWLRFRVIGGPDVPTSTVRTADYTNKSPYFTVGAVTVIGGEAPTAPAASASPGESHSPGATSSPTGAPGTTAPAIAEPSSDPGDTSPVEVKEDSFPVVGACVLGLSVLLVILAATVGTNRWILARQRRRNDSAIPEY
ncbi:DNA-directed RNA polymerase II [Actinomyces sp. zg296]|uniref:DNA-directed RNA polymerase II n=1 Tax=Actinomyces sp. zg296 TaxID=2609289 RepID=UPI001916934B|nr:DNA-directed RNA polymerase II [Actinomyces sp. zg296]